MYINPIDTLTKYAPTTLGGFVGNKAVTRALMDTLKLYPSHTLVIGPSGGGKSTLCDLALRAYQLDVLRINGHEADDSKSLKSLIDNFCGNRTIESFFSKKQKIVFIDDVDILLSCDKTIGSYLLSFVDQCVKDGKMSFVMTCSASEEKRLTELKKKIKNILRLTNPQTRDVFPYITGILDKENVPYESDQILKLVELQNCNIRNIINNLHQTSMDDTMRKEEKSQRILFDSTLYDVMKKLLKTKLTFVDMSIISDSSIVPLLVYENYLGELFNTKLKQPRDKYFSMITSVLDGYITAEIMEQYMYQNADWSLYSQVCICKCGYINTYLSELPNKKAGHYDKYVFTQLLTKSALRYNYNKKLATIKMGIGFSELEYIFLVFDSLASELSLENAKKLKASIPNLFKVSADDLAVVYQYFSQFLEMDKNILTRIKK